MGAGRRASRARRPGHVPAARPGPGAALPRAPGLGLGLRAPAPARTRAPAHPTHAFSSLSLWPPELQDRGVTSSRWAESFPESGLRGLAGWADGGADGSAGDGCS